MAELITCGMCGHQFDPAGHQACGSCPVQSGCQLVCCPACGFETVDPGKSQLVKFANRLGLRLKPSGSEKKSSTSSGLEKRSLN